MKSRTAFKLVKEELERAVDQHSTLNSAHEGFAVLKEEVDELWDEIKANRGTSHRGVSEAVQIAAMAIRFLVDLCPEETKQEHQEKIINWDMRGRESSYGYSG